MKVRSFLSTMSTMCKPYTLYIFGGAWLSSFCKKFKPPSPALEFLKHSSPADYAGKWCIITGGTSGVGFNAASILAENNVNVLLIGDDVEKGEKARDKMKQRTLEKGGEAVVEFIQCDLTSFKSVVECATFIKSEYPYVSILINNAGAFPTQFYPTVDDQETSYQTSYLSHFLLISLLAESLHQNGPSRIVWVSSVLHKLANSPALPPNLEQVFNSVDVYSRTKLAVAMSVHEWNKKFEDNGANITIHSVDPGASQTNILRDFPLGIPFIFKYAGKALLMSARQAAESLVYAALSPEAGKKGGKYIVECEEEKSSMISYDYVLERNLWDQTTQILRMYAPSGSSSGSSAN